MKRAFVMSTRGIAAAIGMLIAGAPAAQAGSGWSFGSSLTPAASVTFTSISKVSRSFGRDVDGTVSQLAIAGTTSSGSSPVLITTSGTGLAESSKTCEKLALMMKSGLTTGSSLVVQYYSEGPYLAGGAMNVSTTANGVVECYLQ